MAAHEEKYERVVFIGCGMFGRGLSRNLERHVFFATAAGRFAANPIGHAAEGDLRQPCAWIFRQSFVGPLGRRGQQSFLNGVFGRGEVTKSANYGAEHLRRKAAQQVLEGSVHHDLVRGPDQKNR